MNLGQNLQVLELSDGIISCPSSLGAFSTSYTHTNVRLSNHRNIISTITDSHSDPLAVVFCESHNI